MIRLIGGQNGMKRQGWSWSVWLWGFLIVVLSVDLYAGIEHGSAPDSRGKQADSREIVQEPKYIALTFDDGPHPVYTSRLLDGLKERNVQASFFLIGQNITGNEELVLRMKEEGHLIGNHSQNHIQLTREGESAVCRQIASTNQQIYEITGQEPVYIRPPFGSWNEELACLVPMTVALWDIDPLDWKVQDTDRIVRHVVEKAEDGGIILLHDVYETSVEAALEIVDRLSEKGYNFVTIDEMFID